MYHIILNPVSGRGNSKAYGESIATRLEETNSPAILHTTKYPRHAYEIAKELCRTSPTGIIGIGGDGTIQEIVAGMAQAFNYSKIPIPLGILPGGSGNDFAMALAGGKKAYKKYKTIESKTSVLADKITTNSTRIVDLITANMVLSGKTEAFLVAGNIGLDSRIVHNAIELKPKHGGRAYLVAAYKSIMQHKNIPLKISVEGASAEQKPYTLVAICNNRTYGGGLCIAPPAVFNDGKITLCTVDGIGRGKLSILFPSLLFEKHVNLKEVNFTECTSLKITLAGKETICLDGNLYPVEGDIEFKILPSVLEVFA